VYICHTFLSGKKHLSAIKIQKYLKKFWK